MQKTADSLMFPCYTIRSIGG